MGWRGCPGASLPPRRRVDFPLQRANRPQPAQHRRRGPRQRHTLRRCSGPQPPTAASRSGMRGNRTRGEDGRPSPPGLPLEPAAWGPDISPAGGIVPDAVSRARTRGRRHRAPDARPSGDRAARGAARGWRVRPGSRRRAVQARGVPGAGGVAGSPQAWASAGVRRSTAACPRFGVGGKEWFPSVERGRNRTQPAARELRMDGLEPARTPGPRCRKAGAHSEALCGAFV